MSILLARIALTALCYVMDVCYIASQSFQATVPCPLLDQLLWNIGFPHAGCTSNPQPSQRSPFQARHYLQPSLYYDSRCTLSEALKTVYISNYVADLTSNCPKLVYIVNQIGLH